MLLRLSIIEISRFYLDLYLCMYTPRNVHSQVIHSQQNDEPGVKDTKTFTFFTTDITKSENIKIISNYFYHCYFCIIVVVSGSIVGTGMNATCYLTLF